MAVTASTNWEVRTTGSDLNGGGFAPTVAGAGTDFSQQDSAQVSVTDAVTTSGSTTITSATANFTSAHVGNVIRISGGTGSQAALHKVVTVVNSATSITVNSSTGIVTGTGVTMALGGAVASIGYCGAHHQGGNMIWVRSGTYNISSTSSDVSGGGIALKAGASTLWTTVVGYTTTRGDFDWANLPRFVNTTGTNAYWSTTGGRTTIARLRIEGINSSQRLTPRAGRAFQCDIKWSGGLTPTLYGCLVEDSVDATNGIAATAYYSVIRRCTTAISFHYRNIVESPTELSYRSGGTAIQCVFYSSAGIGWGWNDDARAAVWIDCVAVRPGSAGGTAFPLQPNTAIINCSAFNYSSLFSGSGDPRQIITDAQTLSADPFTNAATGDFSLTTGGTAALAEGGWDNFAYLFAPTDGTLGCHYTPPATGGGPVVRSLNFSGGFTL